MVIMCGLDFCGYFFKCNYLILFTVVIIVGITLYFPHLIAVLVNCYLDL